MAKKKSTTLIIMASIIGGLFFICLIGISIQGYYTITPYGRTANAETRSTIFAIHTLVAIPTEAKEPTSTHISLPSTQNHLLTSTSTPIPTRTPTQTRTLTSTPIIIGAECLLDPNPVLAQVISITDGDTIHVEINGEEFTLRYIGIDTPESVHPTEPIEFYGPEAAARNAELVEGKEVWLYRDVSETDQFDRLLRYVVVDDIFVNLSLIEEGYAQASSYPPDTTCDYIFSKANQAAKTAAIGMWSQQP